MTRSRRIALVVALAALAAVAAAVPWLGWTSRHQPWKVATGWDRIPAEERPASDELWDAALGERPRLRWLGHAGIRIEWHGSVLVTDPNLNDRCTVAARLLERVEPELVGRVDAVLVSHAHYDHLDLDSLRAIAPAGAIAIPKGAKLFLPDSAAGDAKVIELTSGESFRTGALTVTAVPAAHNGNRFHPLASRIGALGYVISDGTNTIYVAGDTAARNDFEGIRDRYHPRVAILPIGAFLPKFPVGRFHLSPEQAVAVAKRLGVATVVPYHFGTFRLSTDDPEIALPRFAAEARREKLRWVMPQLLTRGDGAQTPNASCGAGTPACASPKATGSCAKSGEGNVGGAFVSSVRLLVASRPLPLANPMRRFAPRAGRSACATLNSAGAASS
ncbi:MAG: MBL fold metallo-hydrolase [Thermoanaerobaculia bacterium]